MKKIGLFGFGCVGQGIYQLLKREGYEAATIVKIVVKDIHKQRVIDEDILSYSAEDIFGDPEIDIIIEAIDNADVAFEIVSRALKNRIPVITANKKMVAEHLKELIWLQKTYSTTLLYEAAVCGAIPVVRKIEEQFGFEPIVSITGIFNGTSNYILSKLFNDKLEYDEALSQAQALGYAESDPTSDVEGFDPKYKSIILAKHAFGIEYQPEEVFNYGIHTLTHEDIVFAKNQNLKIKLVPSIFNQGNQVSVFVLPHFVSKDSQLFSVENEFNALVIESEYAGLQTYSGRGAGAFPTAFSVFGDLRALIQGEHYQYTKSLKAFKKRDASELLIEVYVRYQNPQVKRALDFSFVREGLLQDAYNYVIGETTLQHLISARDLLRTDGSTLIATGKRRIRKGLKTTREKNISQVEKGHLLSA